eukprot:scaffold38152_cov42-Prasinocladus_malaysianus.AAC.2
MPGINRRWQTPDNNGANSNNCSNGKTIMNTFLHLLLTCGWCRAVTATVRTVEAMVTFSLSSRHADIGRTSAN